MQTYTGGCHCKKVRFSVEMELSKAIECNCSYCHMKGLVLAFTPASTFTLTSGDESAMTDYRFNKMKLKHLFCASCGVQSYSRGPGADGSETVAVNVRCLDNVEMSSLELIPYDGKSR